MIKCVYQHKQGDEYMKKLSTNTICNISIALSVGAIIINLLANLDGILSFLHYLLSYPN